MTLKIFIPCNPPKATAQQKGAFALPGGSVRFFKKAYVAKAESAIITLFAPHRPPAPLEGPLFVSICWVFPYRAGEPKKNRTGLIPNVARPDLDNLSKMVGDALTTLRFYNDDSQISQLALSKYYGEPSGIHLEIRTKDL